MRNNRYFTGHANMDMRDKLQAALSVKPVVEYHPKATRSTRKTARLNRVVVAQGGN